MDALADQLNEITAQIPTEIAGQIKTGVDDVTTSGIAPGLAVGDTAPDFALGDAVEMRLYLPTCWSRARLWSPSTGESGAPTATCSSGRFSRLYRRSRLLGRRSWPSARRRPTTG